MAIGFFLAYRDKPSAQGTRDAGGLAKRLPVVVKDRDIWLVTLCCTALVGVEFAYLSYLVLFLEEAQGMSTRLAGGLLAASMAAGAAGRLWWGLSSDLLMGGRRVPALGLASALSAVSMVLMGVLPSEAPVALVSLLVAAAAIAVLGWTGLYGILIAELAGPTLTGTALGSSITVVRLGAFGVPPLFGLLVDRTDSYDMAWWALAGLAAVGTLMLAFLRPQTRGK